MEVLKMKIRVENRFAEIKEVNRFFNDFAQQNGIPDPVRRKFNMVFDELLNNIISYAFHDEGLHYIVIEVQFKNASVTADIYDDGVPFNLFEVSPPDTKSAAAERSVGGLGIHLVRNMMDDYHYERIDNKNRTTIIKHISD